VLVLSSEMAGPCTLDSVQLLCGSDVYNHGIFLDARVYACHTAVAELDSVYEANYGGNTPLAALSVDTLYLSWRNGDWQGLGFDSPFDYNGTDNLILEFRWQGDNDSSVYNLGWYTAGNRAVGAKSSTAERGIPRNYMPRFRVFYSTTGVGKGDVVRPLPGLTVSATPNPFSSRVTLRTAGADQLAVTIYSASGRLVRRLAGTGASSVLRWDGRDGDGKPVPLGAYFCRVRSGNHACTAQFVRRD
jgi:hypothetical protein